MMKSMKMNDPIKNAYEMLIIRGFTAHGLRRYTKGLCNVAIFAPVDSNAVMVGTCNKDGDFTVPPFWCNSEEDIDKAIELLGIMVRMHVV